jgi:hypothetical protein
MVNRVQKILVINKEITMTKIVMTAHSYKSSKKAGKPTKIVPPTPKSHLKTNFPNLQLGPFPSNNPLLIPIPAKPPLQ